MDNKSVRQILVKKGLITEEVSPEKRRYPRLNLTRDFNQTIISRINLPDNPANIKSFANNISLGGLSLETKKEFKGTTRLTLRLFFMETRFL